MYFFAVEIVASRIWLKFSTGSSGAALMHDEVIVTGEWYHVYATRCVASLVSDMCLALIGIVLFRHYSNGALTVTGPEGNYSTVYGSEPHDGATGLLSISKPTALLGGPNLAVVKVI